MIFDVRNDSNAIFSRYSIKLQDVQDLQLIELATTRRWFRQYLNGLANCVLWESGLSRAQTDCSKQVKDRGTRLFPLDKRGSYAVSSE
jgi:exonuclease 3'-5' domain-containing protein 1